jgi:nucleotide-binding universal stress UspA family protein
MGACDIAVHLQDRFCSSPGALVFKTFLVPADIAHLETAGPVIERAVTMAIASRGSVRLLYVHPILPFTYIEFAPIVDAGQREAEQELSSLAATLALPAERVSSTVRSGSVHTEVLDEAEKFGADLIVVGSHRPSMATYLLGSNAASMVRHSRCSVLVVRCDRARNRQSGESHAI